MHFCAIGRPPSDVLLHRLVSHLSLPAIQCLLSSARRRRGARPDCLSATRARRGWGNDGIRRDFGAEPNCAPIAVARPRDKSQRSLPSTGRRLTPLALRERSTVIENKVSDSTAQ